MSIAQLKAVHARTHPAETGEQPSPEDPQDTPESSKKRSLFSCPKPLLDGIATPEFMGFHLTSPHLTRARERRPHRERPRLGIFW